MSENGFYVTDHSLNILFGPAENMKCKNEMARRGQMDVDAGKVNVYGGGPIYYLWDYLGLSQARAAKGLEEPPK